LVLFLVLLTLAVVFGRLLLAVLGAVFTGMSITFTVDDGEERLSLCDGGCCLSFCCCNNT
jgi:hypothetical protein